MSSVHRYTNSVRRHSLVDTISLGHRTEQLPCFPWVVILIRILSEALSSFSVLVLKLFGAFIN